MPNDALINTADPAPHGTGSGPASGRSARVGQWVGIGTLSGVIALAAIAVPPLLNPGEEPSKDVAAPAATATATSLSGGTATSEPASQPPTPIPTPTATAIGQSIEPVPGSPPRTAGPTPGPTADSPARPTTPSPPAPTTPATTPKANLPASFRPVSVEAEDPGNVLSEGAGIVSCPACEGGARVRYLGRLTAYLTTASAGDRTITVSYSVKGDRELKISINGASPSLHHLTGPDWDTPRTFQYTTTVPAGRVSLAFYNDTGPTPDIDKITIS